MTNDRDAVAKLVTDLERISEVCGTYTWKGDARKKSLSIHLKWENEADVVGETMQLLHLVGDAPVIVHALASELLARMDADTEKRAGMKEATT